MIIKRILINIIGITLFSLPNYIFANNSNVNNYVTTKNNEAQKTIENNISKEVNTTDEDFIETSKKNSSESEIIIINPNNANIDNNSTSLYNNTISSQKKEPSPAEKEKIQLAMIMNQVQYATSTIIQTRDREILTQEFDFIINKIDQTKLNNPIVLNSFTNLLKKLSALQLKENERLYVIEMNERERNQAYTKAFSSVGSVHVPGYDLKTIISSIAYNTISAGLNIISAKNEADNKLKEKLFGINQDELNKINEQRKDLFESTAKLYINNEIPMEYEISEEEMIDFIKQISTQENDPENLITIIKNKEKRFKNFPIFWFQLGSHYQILANRFLDLGDKNNKDGNIQEALRYYDEYNKYIKESLDCYDKFESLNKDYSYLKRDPYFTAVAKNRIIILQRNIKVPNLGREKYQEIENEIIKYLKIIEDNSPDTASENRLFRAAVYFDTLHDNKKAKELLNINIIRGEDYCNSNKILSLIEFEEKKGTNDLYTTKLIGADEIKFKVDEDKKILTITMPNSFILNSFVYLIVNKDIIYPNIIPLEKNNNNIESDISFAITEYDNNKFKIIIGIANNKGTTEFAYDCNFLEESTQITDLLNSINQPLENIEPCLFPELFAFSYNLDEDKDFSTYSMAHRAIITKNDTKASKEKIEQDIKNYGEMLKREKFEIYVSNLLRKKLSSMPYYYSGKVKIPNKKEWFIYSLKRISNETCEYTFNKFQIPVRTWLAKPSFVNPDIDMLKDLVLKAMNNNSEAQYDLAYIYEYIFSNKANIYFNHSIYIPGYGLIPEHKEKVLLNKKDRVFYELWANWGNTRKSRMEISAYWYKKAADNGNKDAATKYAELLENGDGVNKNKSLAKYYRAK